MYSIYYYDKMDSDQKYAVSLVNKYVVKKFSK